MKKLLWVFIPILCVSFLCGVALGSKPKDFHVLEITETGDVVIDAGDNITKPKKKFDIFKTSGALTTVDNPNVIIDGIEIPIARILITQTTPTYSIGTIINRMDGSKPQISDISRGMLCRETTSKTLAAEKKIYKYQKKALKRQYKLTKLKAKSGTYEALDKIAQDTNGIDKITTSVVHQSIEKHRDKSNNSSAEEVSKCSVCGTIGGKDSQWHMVNGKLICLDCYKKMENDKKIGNH